tara:strand:+ start:112 stop:357 length:246 start_codon:yes stop_codon:yes gene_type:complete
MTGYDLVAWLIIYGVIHILFINPILYLGGIFLKKVLRVILPPTIWILKQFQKEKVYYAEGAKDEALTYSEEYEIKEPSFDG